MRQSVGLGSSTTRAEQLRHDLRCTHGKRKSISCLVSDRRELAELGLSGIADHQPQNDFSSRVAAPFLTPTLLTDRKTALFDACRGRPFIEATLTPARTVTVRTRLP